MADAQEPPRPAKRHERPACPQRTMNGTARVRHERAPRTCPHPTSPAYTSHERGAAAVERSSTAHEGGHLERAPASHQSRGRKARASQEPRRAGSKGAPASHHTRGLANRACRQPPARGLERPPDASPEGGHGAYYNCDPQQPPAPVFTTQGTMPARAHGGLAPAGARCTLEGMVPCPRLSPAPTNPEHTSHPARRLRRWSAALSPAPRAPPCQPCAAARPCRSAARSGQQATCPFSRTKKRTSHGGCPSVLYAFVTCGHAENVGCRSGAQPSPAGRCFCR